MSGVSDPYIREQLEKRRRELNAVIASPDAAAPAASLLALLGEVDSALHRMDDGTYGICTECHDTVEKDRLLADPLVTLCLDHLTSDEQRALERDLELASRVQRGLLPRTDLRHGDWQRSLSIQTRGNGERRLLRFNSSVGRGWRAGFPAW